MNRLEQINGQFASGKQFVSSETITIDGKTYPQIIDSHQSRGVKTDYINPQGWGYNDSGFYFDKKDQAIKIKGHRYQYGGLPLPNFLPYLRKELHADIDFERPKQDFNDMPVEPSVINHAFVEELGTQNFSRRSFARNERVLHSHGHTFQEIHALRHDRLGRYTDMIVYPLSTEQCENLVQLANKHDVVIVPYGGGTNVTQSLMLPMEEKRMIVSVDMSRMNAIKWVDKENNLACIQCGIIGTDLERDLKQYGVISGHEPDSMEFSSLGGWISTRASGMKKNTYGNIEDIVQNITMVTSKGTYNKVAAWPRVSNGPDLNHLVMGSEGNYGIITEAVIKVKPLPEVRIFDSILFYDWESGVKFMHAVSKTKNYPTSCRLVDNQQFQFGSTLKPAAASQWESFVEAAKKFFVLNVKGYDPEKLTAATMLFEGPKVEMEALHKTVMNMAKKFGGMSGGPENGLRGYMLTFLITYMRDIACEYAIAAESFETSCSWQNVLPLCERVKKRIFSSGEELGYKDKIWCCFRVTQLYETGCAVYVYFSLYNRGTDTDKIVHDYERVEDCARDEVMLAGGSISHHHGVGKIRKGFVHRTLPKMALDWQKSVKFGVDPNNIFAINNTIYKNDEEMANVMKKF